MKIQSTYLAAGINQTRKSLDWNTLRNLILFASSNQILLYNLKDGCVVGMSDQNHGVFINSVQWINKERDKSFILSTSSDGSVKVWHLEDVKGIRTNQSSNSIHCSIKILTVLKAHDGSVSCGCGVLLSSQNNGVQDEIFIVTTGDDFYIKGWKIKTESASTEEVFCHKLPGRSLAIDLLIIPCPDDASDKYWPIIIYGSDNGKINIMTSRSGQHYMPENVLSGHQDWITSLAYCVEAGGDILISSGSKDGLIKLWRLSRRSLRKDVPGLLQVKDTELKVPRMKVLHMQEKGMHQRVSMQGTQSEEANEGDFITFCCSLESVLHGHDGIVSCLDWDCSQDGPPRLLSCSMTEDRSLAIWEAEIEENTDLGIGVWVEKVRLGEVGGNREGFFSAKFGANGNEVVATSYQGGFHFWRTFQHSWLPQPVVSGHFNEVVDLDWAQNGKYLLTVSKDQTTRLHFQWQQGKEKVLWREIARPQVHGYDMSCVASLPKFRFASGSEEKVVRGFCATRAFVRRIKILSASPQDINEDSLDLPEVASVPSLGLSNKGEEVLATETVYAQGIKIDENHCVPPTEDELMLGTLWPEVSKLYSHGNELIALAASHDGRLLASACRASNEIDAKIILWNTNEWKEKTSISHHRLSVTQIEFSSCDQFLLTVSRDRSWAVFRRDAEREFVLRFHSGLLEKKYQHSRIIWSCTWVPNSFRFITGSRDKTVSIWEPQEDACCSITSWKKGTTFAEKQEVTAVAAARIHHLQEMNFSDDWIMAIGFANGSVLLRLLSGTSNEVLESFELDVCHRKSVRRLKFRPRTLPTTPITLASCGNDHAVLIHEIYL